jgi:hypothetical protein
MARNNTRPLTDGEREQRRQAQRRQFEDALSALLSSDGWKRWLRTRATLHGYSAKNTLLIAHQGVGLASEQNCGRSVSGSTRASDQRRSAVWVFSVRIAARSVGWITRGPKR